jgi:hypothetical protein
MPKFIAAMKAEQARGDAGADLSKARPLSATGWADAYAMKQVLEQMIDAGTEINHTTFLEAFGKASNLDTGGVTTYKWSPSVHSSIPGYGSVTNTLGYMHVVKNGKLVAQSTTPVDTSKMYG